MNRYRGCGCGSHWDNNRTCVEVPLCDSRCVAGLKVYASAAQSIPTDFSTPLTLSEAAGDGPAPYTIAGATIQYGAAGVWNQTVTVQCNSAIAQGFAVFMMTMSYTDGLNVSHTKQLPISIPFSVQAESGIAICNPVLYITTNLTLSALSYDAVTETLTGTAAGAIMVNFMDANVDAVPFLRDAPNGPCPTTPMTVYTDVRECCLPMGQQISLNVMLPELTGTAPFTVQSVTLANTQAGAAVINSVINGMSTVTVSGMLPMTVTVMDNAGVASSYLALGFINVDVSTDLSGIMTPIAMLLLCSTVTSFSYDAASNVLTLSLRMAGRVLLASPTPESGQMLTFTLPCCPHERMHRCSVSVRPA